MEHTLAGDTRAVLGRYLRRKLKLPLQIAGGAVAAAALMGAAVSHHGRKVDPTAPVPMTEVPTEGSVRSLYSKSVSAPFAGTVLAMNIQPGQQVHKGQVLFRMDTRDLKAQLAQAHSDAAAASAAYRKARADEAADEREVYASIGAIRAQIRAQRQAAAQAQAQPAPVEDTENADGSISVTAQPAPAANTYDPAQEQALQSQLSALNAQLAERRQAWAPTLKEAANQSAVAQQQVTRLTRLLAHSEQVSPADGVVTELYAKAGTSIEGGQKVARIDNPTGYRIVALVDQKSRDRMDPGQDIRLKLPSGATTGTVDKIVSGVDKQLFTYQVWVKPDGDVTLKPGQPIQVMVPKPIETAMLR